jgi:DNA-binding NtrC family response regulator
MPEIKASILVIEDEEPFRNSIKTILEEEEYIVHSAENGFDALNLIKQMFFDIILVDFKLPDMNGLDLIKKALTISRETIPIIITATSSIETAVESMRIGAHDYLIKPIDMDELKKHLFLVLMEREEFKKGKQRFQDILENISEKEPAYIERLIQKGCDTHIKHKGTLNIFLTLINKISQGITFQKRN